jgi:RNA polymerase sigma-70 factor (ECF subfamily)
MLFDIQAAARTSLTQALLGSADRFMHAVRPLLGSIHCVCFGILQNGADVEEVAQETLMKAWSHIGELREPGHLRAWLLRIAVTESLLRRKRDHRHLFENRHCTGSPDTEADRALAEFADPRNTPDQDLECSETRKAIGTAILALPLIYRQVFLLRDIQQLSGVETAGILDISIEAVMTRLHRARLRMRGQLAPFFNKPGSDTHVHADGYGKVLRA